jgi:hypothetical protein
MERHDQRRRQGGGDEPRWYPPHNEERGRERDAWRPDDDRNRHRAGSNETGWLDYDPNPGRSDERSRDRGGREQPRYGQGGAERSSFSPDWSREGAEPRYSDDPYYSRNRDRGSDDYSRGGVGDYSGRSRERGRSGDYNSPDWPYDRGGQGRDLQSSRDDEAGGHYRGYYSRSTTPFAYPGGQGYLYSESITLHGPYSGRGPKGYKRSDQQLIDDASQRLERDGHIDATDIEVGAEDGVIVLRGTVPDRRTKRLAEECVESVYGVRDVMNELRVSLQSGEQSQSSQASLGAQGSQRSQSSRGSQASQSSTPASRGGVTASGSEQSGEDRRPPKH